MALGFSDRSQNELIMRLLIPESGNHRGHLLLHGPFGVGTMIGAFLGSIAAPSILSAALVTLVGSLLGLCVGIALTNWRAGPASAGYRPLRLTPPFGR